MARAGLLHVPRDEPRQAHRDAALRVLVEPQLQGPSGLADWAESQLSATAATPLLDEALPAFERTLITAALRRARGKRLEAAKLLGWGRNTLTRKIRELGLEGRV